MKQKLIELLRKNNIVKFGEFTLTSGKTTAYYADIKKATTIPEVFGLIADLLVQDIDKKYDKIVGPAVGGVPFATAISLKTKIPMLIARLAKREHGTKTQIEGEFNRGDTVLIVDDVITTGGTTLKIIKLLREAGLAINEVFVVIDREEGGRENLAKEGVKLHSLLKISELK